MSRVSGRMGIMSYQLTVPKNIKPKSEDRTLWSRFACGSSICPVSGQSPAEEVANVLTHGLGLLLSIAGVAVLIVLASIHGNAWHIVGTSVYGATLIMVYVASTLYHGSRSIGVKKMLRDVDQVVIFLLIAGTYTPFTLGPLNGGWGWSLFGVVWGVSVLGILLKVLFNGRFRAMSVPIYLGLGWLCVVAVVPLMNNLSPAGLLWLAFGGAAYSLGTIFIMWRKLPFNHAIWHLTVILGSALHYFAIMFYVVPLA